MFEIQGKKATAICYASVIEDDAIEQIRRMCDYDFTEGSHICIMPDAHSGKGCTIGTTMTITDMAVPNIVGVDIGCGMYTVNLGKVSVEFKKLDSVVHEIPSSMNVWDSWQEKFDLTQLKCYRELKNIQRLKNSLGTLGGGNHFIEIDASSDGTKYLVIHSGSRNLGKQVAEYYQKFAVDLHSGIERYINERQLIIDTYKEQDRKSEIESALKKLKWSRQKCTIPEDLCWLYGEYLEDYLHDVAICQEFARKNREFMANYIVGKMHWMMVDSFHTIHNYIETDEKILRKGAISARKDEIVLIPINMRDGSILAKGKGNPDWNFSAPHGAGRVLSRTAAKNMLSLTDYEDCMKNVYTTSVNLNTIDEAPMAYKNIDDILDSITESVSVLEILKPIYNFKAG